MTWIFIFVSGLAWPLELLIAVFGEWGVGMQWTIDLLKDLSVPDSQWETAIEPNSWLVGEYHLFPRGPSGPHVHVFTLDDLSKNELDTF